MVAEQRGYDAMVTAAQRRSSEEEHVEVEHKIAGRRKCSVEERLSEMENSCAVEEETTGGPVGVRQQGLVNGLLGNSHWRRCRVHQEAARGHRADGAQDGSDGCVRQFVWMWC